MDIFSYLLGKQAGGGGGGGDLSEYFLTDITSNIDGAFNQPIIIKKVPKITIGENVQHLNYVFKSVLMESFEGFNNFTSNINQLAWTFQYCEKLTTINTKGWDTSNVTSFNGTFDNCSALVSLDLSDWKSDKCTNMVAMFRYCSNLMHLDIRNFTFDQNPSFTAMFNGVPTNCEIIVKSNTEKTWINNNFPAMTNVKTVDEL